MKKHNALLLMFALLFSACSSDDKGENNVRKDIVLGIHDIGIVNTQINSTFDMLRYFDACSDEPNFMVSPLSLSLIHI